MGEYLLYFTIHEEVETLPFPEHYEAVDLPANWKEEVEAPAYQEAIETIHHHIRQRYLPGQLHCPAFSRAKSRSFGYIQSLGGRAESPLQCLHPARWCLHPPSVLSSFWARRPATDHAPHERNDAPWSHQPRGSSRGCLARSRPEKSSRNMMIVDLLRNDMNRFRRLKWAGDHLCQVEQYSLFGRWPRPLKVAYELKSTWSKPSELSFLVARLQSTEDLHYGNHPKDGEVSSRCLLWNDRHPSSKKETDF